MMRAEPIGWFWPMVVVAILIILWLAGCAFHMGDAEGGWTGALGQSDVCTAGAGVSTIPIPLEDGSTGELPVLTCGGIAIRGEGFSDQAAETLEGIGRGAGGIVGGALRGAAGVP